MTDRRSQTTARARACAILVTKGDDSVHLIKVRLAKLEGCLRDCVAVAKHPQNTAQRSGITRYDERYIISLTFTIKIITLLFGVHAFNAFQAAAPGSGSLEVWNRWDSPAYLNVARHGYTSTGPDRVQLVILPLYPFCVHAFAVIARNYLISAFVVSGVAAAVAAVLLYKLTRLDNSRATALKAVWLMLIFPSSFFLHIAYAESLFLALAIGCLYAARSDRWMVSGITGALAAMTRINGLILIPALATEAIQQFISSRKWRSQWLWALAPLGGFAAYLFANYTTTGDALAFLSIQHENWHKSLDWPWRAIHGSFDLIRFGRPNEASIRGLEESLFIVLGLACSVAAWLTMRPAYASWMTLNWILFTSVGFILCIPRYTLVMFPIYILLAHIARYRICAAIITTWCLLSSGLLIALFVRGWWVS
jgi:hypothetical protein